jgi:hypothetical protein
MDQNFKKGDRVAVTEVLIHAPSGEPLVSPGDEGVILTVSDGIRHHNGSQFQVVEVQFSPRTPQTFIWSFFSDGGDHSETPSLKYLRVKGEGGTNNWAGGLDLLRALW